MALAVFVIALAAFIWQERRAEAPMVTPGRWLKRPIAFANLAVFFASMSIMGLTTFLPMYVQTVLNGSPVVAGFASTMLLLGWPCGATIATRSFARIGLRPIMIVGSLCIPPGTCLLVLLTSSSSALLAGAGSLVMGFGMALLNISALILTHDSVSWSERGHRFKCFLAQLGQHAWRSHTRCGAGLWPGQLYGWPVDHGGTVAGPAECTGVLMPDAESIRLALQHALHSTFIVMLVFAVLIVPACFFVPNPRWAARCSGHEASGKAMPY